jgi:hypothetical protein
MQKTALIIERGLLILVLAIVVWEHKQRAIKRWWKAWRAKPKRERHLQARTPADCQDCRLAEAERVPERVGAPQPWGEVKSSQGRPKTHGYSSAD